MRTHLRLAFLFFLVAASLFSQTTINKYENQQWFGYYNSIDINPKWSINSDIQGRTKNELKDWSQALIRTGLAYKWSQRISVTAGLAHFRYFLTNTITRGEWRPWEEIAIHDRIGKCKLTHRFRFEQRFNQKTAGREVLNDYTFNYRLRYRFDLLIPLIKVKEEGRNLSLIIGNELMINAGKQVAYNYFDQDRLYAGINYEVNRKLSLQLQYMHIWQQLSPGNVLDNIEVIRFNIYHTIKL